MQLGAIDACPFYSAALAFRGRAVAFRAPDFLLHAVYWPELWKKVADGKRVHDLFFITHKVHIILMESDASYDVVKCDSCRTPMLTYYTSDKLILYICPNCVDWSATETMNKDLMFIN